MAKFSVINKLTKKEADELFIRIVSAIAALRNPMEAANFLKDLLSEQEAIMLARRLQIADLLTQGLTYEQIHRLMKVGDSTIARVQTWLKLYGEGYRMVLKRTAKSQKISREDSGSSWRLLKQKYPMYYWPELLLKEIVKSANTREKRRLLRVVEDLRAKTKMARELTTILK